MERRLKQFYESFGDKGVMFILYVLSVVMNVFLSIFAELPSVYPDEINSAGIAALYSGRDWSGLLNGMTGDSGFVQALFYMPLFLAIKNPYALYKAMLIVNAFVISFVPIIVYHLAGKFGVLRVRRKLLIAICCGMYTAYITSSKFIWNESFSCFFVWLLTLCMFGTWDKNNKGSRATHSMIVGFLCAVAYASNKSLISIVFALILTVVFARIVLREKLLNLPVFAITLFASFAAERFLRMTIEQRLFGGVIGNGFGEIAKNDEAAGRFFGAFFSHVYAFMTSSVGMGALAAAVFVVILFSYLTEGVKGRAKILEDGTKIYEPVKHKYSARLTVFASFQFLAVGCTAIVSALFTMNPGGYNRETVVFGRYTDTIAPFAIFLVLVYIFLYGIDIAKLFIGAVIYGYSCFCFAVAGYRITQTLGSFMYSSLFGIFPMILGENHSESKPGMQYIIMSSIVLTLYALMIVFVSCTRRTRTTLVTVTVFCVLLAASAYSGIVYFPRMCSRNSEELTACKEVAEMLYNNSQSPPVIIYKADPKFAGTLQFLVPDTRVQTLEDGETVSESCLLVAQSDAGVPFDGGSYDIVGRVEGYTLYAYGESARDFINFSSSKDKNNAEGPSASGAASTSGSPSAGLRPSD